MENPRNDVAGVSDNLEEVTSQVGERARELQATLRRFVDDNPLGAVGIAFGVGYLLSGALFSRTSLKLAGIGGRFIAGGFVRQLIAGVAPGVIDALVGHRPST